MSPAAPHDPVTDADVAIVGGGVAGSAAACALARTGLRVALFERRPLRLDANRGDALHAAAVATLERWDAVGALEARGAFWVRRIQLTTRRPHGPRVRFALDRAPLLVLAHAGIELGLSEVAQRAGATLHDARVDDVLATDDGWTVVAGDSRVRARLLVGADGASSLVRRRAGIDVERHDYDQTTVVLHARRPDWLGADLMWVLAHRDGGVLALPTTPHGQCRVVVQMSPATLTRWRGADADERRSLLQARHRDLGELQLIPRGGAHVYRLSRQQADRYVADRCALVGDAAHVTHPNGGQGMAMAIHDADVLSRCVGPVLAAGDDPDRLRAALWEYAARRRPACGAAIARAHRSARTQNGSRTGYAAAWTGLAAFTFAPRVVAHQFQRFGGT